MHVTSRSTLTFQVFFVAVALTMPLFAQTAAVAPPQPVPSAAGTAASTRAYADYLKAFEAAEPGSRPAALRLLAESLRLDPHGNPAAQLAFNLLVEQRADTPVKLLGETGIFSSAVYSPDGTKILTTATDRTARLWDAGTGAPLGAPMEHDEEVAAAAFSPDGRSLATGTSEGEVTLWDAATGKKLPGSMKLSSGAVWSISFSPDGTILAAASDAGRARTWDATNGKPLTAELTYHEAAYQVSFSRDSRFLVIPTGDDYADVRDARTGVRRFKLASGNTLVYAQYSPDDGSILTAGRDSRVRLWNAATGQPSPIQFQHGYAVEYAGFSADGHTILTASLDHTARVWDAQTGRALTPPLQRLFSGQASALTAAGFTPLPGTRQSVSGARRAVTLSHCLFSSPMPRLRRSTRPPPRFSSQAALLLPWLRCRLPGTPRHGFRNWRILLLP